VNDCALVAGTTARQRHMPFVFFEPRECAALVVDKAHANNVALVFGAERTGLSNTELNLCNFLVTIPTSDAYSSLNIAMAVQILCYEVLLAARAAPPVRTISDEPLATMEDMERFYAHLEQALAGSQFRDHTNSGHLMSRVRRIFNRAQLDQNEMRILRGILSALQSRVSAAENNAVKPS
jgi:TrmH family RNA methyltransferase